MCLFSLLHTVAVTAKESKLKSTDHDSADNWKKKDIRDYSEADLERLYEQWEVRTCLFTIIIIYYYYLLLLLA